MRKIKSVKAWAVFDTGDDKVRLATVEPTRKRAGYYAASIWDCKIVRVLITPIVKKPAKKRRGK